MFVGWFYNGIDYGIMLQKIGIKFSNADSAQYEHGNGTYAVLSASQRRDLRQWLESQFNPRDINTVERLITDWKDDSYCDDAQTLEKIFKQALSINEPLRNGSLSGRNPRGDEPDIAEALSQVTTAFLDRLVSNEEITIFRGVGHERAELAREVFENHGHPTLSVDTNALSNYSPSPDVAEYFGSVVLEQQVRLDKVALAADCLYPYQASSGTLGKCHGELRVSGDAVSSVPNPQIWPEGFNRALVDLIRNPQQNSVSEHEVVAGLVEDMADEGLTLSTPPARRTVKTWYKHYLKDKPSQAFNLHSEINVIT